MPRKEVSLTLSQFHNPPPIIPNPNPGEIWWVTCSMREVILDAAKQYSFGPLSQAMVSELTSLGYNGAEKKSRPCIILRVHPFAQTATVVPLGTFGGRSIGSLDRYTRELCISVDRTRPWPNPSAYVVHPDPSWPLSLIRPCYAISHSITIKYSSLGKRYAWPVDGPRGAADAAAVAAILAPRTPRLRWIFSPPASLSIAEFSLDDDERAKLRVEMQERTSSLKKKPVGEILEMNASYDASRWVPL